MSDLIRKVMVIAVWRNSSIPPEQKILLLKRNPSDGGEWQPVTGKVEQEEDFLDAALREFQEETGLEPPEQPAYLGLEHDFTGRWGDAVERSYRIVFTDNQPPEPVLDGQEHTEFAWLNIDEALARVIHSQQKTAIKRATTVIPPFVLNKQGGWLQDGEEVTHERTVQLLFDSMQKENGRWYIVTDGLKVPVQFEDAVFYVTRIDRDNLKVHLLGGKSLDFQPNDLELTGDSALYLNNVFGEQARLLKNAYYDLARDITEQKDSSGRTAYVFHFQNKAYVIN